MSIKGINISKEILRCAWKTVAASKPAVATVLPCVDVRSHDRLPKERINAAYGHLLLHCWSDHQAVWWDHFVLQQFLQQHLLLKNSGKKFRKDEKTFLRLYQFVKKCNENLKICNKNPKSFLNR